MTTKNEKRRSIAVYKFEDDKSMIRSVIAGNLILAILFLVGDWFAILRDFRTQICLLSGILFLIANMCYSWESPKMNMMLLLIYLVIFLIEIIYLGIPESPISFNQNRLSKGAMFEMFLGFLPYLYIGLRIALILPIIQILLSSKKIKKEYQMV